MRIERKIILDNLYYQIEKKIPIIGCGAGVGLSAKAERMGGADLLICYSTGYFRMHGLPSNIGILPTGDANTIVCNLAHEILPQAKTVPVIAAVFAHDPFRDMRTYLEQLAEMGFSGVQNFPNINAYDGNVSKRLKSAGFTPQKEIDMIRMAHEMDLLTTPYCWDEEESVEMAKVGADCIVIHLAMTVGGTNGVDKSAVLSLEDSCAYMQKISDAVRRVRDDIIVIAHGGAVAYPEDLQYVFDHTTGIHGYFGASSIERIPVEKAISGCVSDFKSVTIR